MNKRRLSYGLLVTLAAAALMVGCGDSTPPVENPPQPTAAPADTGAPAPSQTAAAEPAATQAPAEPPPPPPKPAKDKFSGSFAQDFSGDVQAAAQAAADKAGGAKKDQKKIDAAMDKAKKAFDAAAITLDTTDKMITWTAKGKKAHELTYEISGKADDPSALTLKVVKDGKKDLSKKPIEISVSFSDDTTFSFTDPFTAKDPKKLVFKKK